MYVNLKSLVIAKTQFENFTFSKLTFRETARLNRTNSFKPLVNFCGCTVQFVLDLVGISDNRFSHDVAHIKVGFERSCLQRSISMML